MRSRRGESHWRRRSRAIAVAGGVAVKVVYHLSYQTNRIQSHLVSHFDFSLKLKLDDRDASPPAMLLSHRSRPARAPLGQAASRLCLWPSILPYFSLATSLNASSQT